MADLPFKGGGDTHFRPAAAYEHMSDLVVKKKNYKDAEGLVITAPRNFTTNPPKKGNPATCPGTLF